jgi:5'-nucleotidase / UDP-sugar diphosphatase
VSLDSPVGYYASQPLGVMIVDYNRDPRNNNGGQAYFEPIIVEGIFGLTLLHTNDYHARVDEYNRNGARCTEATAAAGQCIAGAPRVAQVVDNIQSYNENVLVLDASDQFQRTLFFTLFQGDVLNETMNYIGYDAMAVGKHEFDSGPATLADFIGVIGLTTPETENISSPGPNITFNDSVTSLQDSVDVLTLMGVDKIIALTHQGYEQDLELAEQVSSVDVIISGHSHTFTYSPTDPIKFGPPEFPQYDPLTPAGE